MIFILIGLSIQFILGQSSREYIVVKQDKNWNDAKTYCANEYGSTLATVATAEDLANILALMSDADETGIWVGLNDFDTEGTWVWLDGTPCTNPDGDCINGNDDTPKWWGDGEPNNVNGGEHCAQIYPNTNSGRTAWWNDEVCTRTFAFACNLDETSNPTSNPTMNPTVREVQCSGDRCYNLGVGDDGNTDFRICEGYTGTFSCTSGVLHLVSCWYGSPVGDPGKGQCPHSSVNSNCNPVVGNCANYIGGQCEGKTECTISINNGIMGGDPCGGVYKFGGIEFECQGEPTPNPTPLPTVQVCSEADIGSFNWETLVKDGADAPQFDVVEFNVSEDSLTLDIMVELEYLGSVMGDSDDGADYGVTYVLDFEDYNAHTNKINEPGSCQNRNGDDFTSLSFEEYWDYSDQPLWDNVGSSDYLAYPPPGDEWSVYMKEGDECSTIIYEGHFHWNDLVSCVSYDGSIDYITTTDGEGEITLDGVFYINVVSPFVPDSETGYYRVYQLLSQPFTISISKSVFVMGSTGINILSMSVISVYKEDGANTFRLIVLTESYEYLILTRDNNNLYIYSPSDGGSIETGDFTASSDAVSVDEGCLDNKEFVCTQLWEITAENVDCRNGNDKGIDFSGDYTLQFVPECRSVDDIGSDLNTYCDGWLSSHSDIADGVDLLATLIWKDEVCDPLLFEMQFEASMSFYIDENYATLAADDQLYQAGEDTIYVEIGTSFPSDTYSVFDTELINVWICTFDPLEGPQEPIDPNTASGGCFSANRDGGNDETEDNPYFYHIYSSDGPIEEEGFDLIGHPDDSDSNKNKLQFSFIVPSKIRRDTLYIHSQIEVSLTDQSEEQFRRRLLQFRASANQMDHFLGNIGINRNEKPNHDENYNYNPNPNQYQPPPQQIPYQSPSATTTTTWSFYLSSSWIIGIGSVLGLILFGNILYLFYVNCLNKRQRSRVSFNHRRRSGYDSVKNVDSEDFDNSDAHLIVDQPQHQESE